MKPVVQKNRTFYGGVVLTVLEGLLSGCTFLSIFLLLRMLAEGTVTRAVSGDSPGSRLGSLRFACWCTASGTARCRSAALRSLWLCGWAWVIN